MSSTQVQTLIADAKARSEALLQRFGASREQVLTAWGIVQADMEAAIARQDWPELKRLANELPGHLIKPLIATRQDLRDEKRELLSSALGFGFGILGEALKRLGGGVAVLLLALLLVAGCSGGCAGVGKVSTVPSVLMSGTVNNVCEFVATCRVNGHTEGGEAACAALKATMEADPYPHAAALQGDVAALCAASKECLGKWTDLPEGWRPARERWCVTLEEAVGAALAETP